MANNGIKGRFKKLYSKVQNNLNSESRTILEDLFKLNQTKLHEYRNEILSILENEYTKLISELAKRLNTTVKRIDDSLICNKWTCYSIAIERLNESIRIVPTKLEELEQEEMREQLFRLIEEDRKTLGIDKIFDENNDDSQIENFYLTKNSRKNENYIRKKDESHSDIFEIIEKELVEIIKTTEKKFKITGQVIDFLIELYPLCD